MSSIIDNMPNTWTLSPIIPACMLDFCAAAAATRLVVAQPDASISDAEGGDVVEEGLALVVPLGGGKHLRWVSVSVLVV